MKLMFDTQIDGSNIFLIDQKIDNPTSQTYSFYSIILKSVGTNMLRPLLDR